MYSITCTHFKISRKNYTKLELSVLAIFAQMWPKPFRAFSFLSSPPHSRHFSPSLSLHLTRSLFLCLFHRRRRPNLLWRPNPLRRVLRRPPIRMSSATRSSRDPKPRCPVPPRPCTPRPELAQSRASRSAEDSSGAPPRRSAPPIPRELSASRPSPGASPSRSPTPS